MAGAIRLRAALLFKQLLIMKSNVIGTTVTI